MPMPKTRRRRWIVGLGLALFGLLGGGGAAWVSVTHQPTFYRERVAMPRARAKEEARRFIAQSLQLRNDIVNEPRWEAVFSDQEVNAWLAEDLVTQFADQIPPGVAEPRVLFEPDRVTLAFQLDRGPVRAVVWVVARVRVPAENQLALTVEKIRAGLLPVAADEILESLARHGRERGLDIQWGQDGDLPMALIRYTTDPERADVVLEQLRVVDGKVRLSGRSRHSAGAAVRPVLPRGRVLQSTFRRRNTQAVRSRPAAAPPALHSSASPTS